MLHELSGFRSVFWMRSAGFDHWQPLAQAAANAAKWTARVDVAPRESLADSLARAMWRAAFSASPIAAASWNTL